jgi:transposase
MSRSIVVLDNAKIHMYQELQQVIQRSGAVLMFIRPNSPQLNPIEKGFALLKQWLKKNADLTFRICPAAAKL